MSVFAHNLTATYDGQHVAVNIPAFTIADSLAPTGDHFDRLKASVDDADCTRSGIELRPSDRHAAHDETVAVLADNLGAIGVSLTSKALLQFVTELVAVAVDHSIVGPTALPDLKAAANLIDRVRRDEAHSAAIRDRSTRTTPRLHSVPTPVAVA